MEFNTLKKMVFVQLDKALELYMSHSYNEDEDVELLKLFAMIADVNRDWVREEASSNRFIADILDDVLTFTRDKEVQNMITVEELDRIHYHSNIMLAKREGRDEGRNEGHVDILSLYKWLHSQNRDSDFDKATDNPTYLDSLLDEYNSSNET